MKLCLRNGATVEKSDAQDKILTFFYTTAFGRILLKPLIRPRVSVLAGKFLSTRFSKVIIKPFIHSAQIDMSEYEEENYESYNAFFSRHIRPQCRPIDMDKTHFISPCDSKLTVFPITEDGIFTVKYTDYSVSTLLRDHTLAQKYIGGTCLIFRLAVNDYHRYCYIADGVKGENVRIPGIFHTVNPIANDSFPIYKENTREYSVLSTDIFGDVVVMEVGALMVGKIVNHHEAARVLRGEEKGYFKFGGSTIVLLVPKGALCVDSDIVRNCENGFETVVHMGEKIGAASGDVDIAHINS